MNKLSFSIWFKLCPHPIPVSWEWAISQYQSEQINTYLLNVKLGVELMESTIERFFFLVITIPAEKIKG